MRKEIELESFAGFSEKLDNLDEYSRSKIIELIWCIRKGKLSITACTFDFDAFLNMLTGPYKEIIMERVDRDADGWAIDLESLDDDRMGKYYEYFKNSNKVAIGYNLNLEEEVFEVKEYFGTDQYIRASKSGDEVQIAKAREEIVSIDKWPGPKGLIDICKTKKLQMAVSTKRDKDQWYMRIRDIGII